MWMVGFPGTLIKSPAAVGGESYNLLAKMHEPNLEFHGTIPYWQPCFFIIDSMSIPGQPSVTRQVVNLELETTTSRDLSLCVPLSLALPTECGGRKHLERMWMVGFPGTLIKSPAAVGGESYNLLAKMHGPNLEFNGTIPYWQPCFFIIDWNLEVNCELSEMKSDTGRQNADFRV
nr:hypothetical protein Iba_chr05cCG6900 [Ipomoea batatas]